MTTRLLAPQVVVDGPPVTPPPHGLRDSAREIPELENRWEAGLIFAPESCMTVKSWSPACDQGTGLMGPTWADAPVPPNFVTVATYGLYVPFTCTALGEPSRDDKGRVTRALEAATSKGMEKAFWSDLEATGNFSLKGSTPNVQGDAWTGVNGILNDSATTAPVAVTPAEGIGLLSQALGAGALGSRGMIHTPAYVAQLLSAAGHSFTDGPRLLTASRGDIVVVGSGYDGSGPTGNPAATRPAGKCWMYATDMLEYRLGDIEFLPDEFAQLLDRKQNMVTWVGQRMAAQVIDGCRVFAVLVTL